MMQLNQNQRCLSKFFQSFRKVPVQLSTAVPSDFHDLVLQEWLQNYASQSTARMAKDSHSLSARSQCRTAPVHKNRKLEMIAPFHRNRPGLCSAQSHPLTRYGRVFCSFGHSV